MGLQLIACSGQVGTVFEPVRAPTERYRARAAELSIVDQRRNDVTERRFDTPLISMPNEREQRELAIDSKLRATMSHQLGPLLTATSANALFVELHVQDAQAGFRTTWWHEIALARVRLKVCVEDAQDHAVLIAGWAESWAEVWSLDVADDEPARLLDKAVVAAWLRFVSNDDTIRATNQAMALRAHGGRLLASDAECNRSDTLSLPSTKIRFAKEP